MKPEQITHIQNLLPGHACVFNESPAFNDYIRDESVLRGNADMVALPETHDEIKKILLYANEQAEQGKPFCITTRGGGSGLSGAVVPEKDLVLCMARMNKFIGIDTVNFLATAQAGIITADLQKKVQDKGLCYPVDVSSAEISTLGGNIAANAAGPSSLKYGTTRTNLAQIRVVFANGHDAFLGALPRKTSTGLDLMNMVVGSEGRLCIVTQATVRLTMIQPAEISALVFFDNYQTAATSVAGIRKICSTIKAIEFIDEKCISLQAQLWPREAREAKALLLLDFDGTENFIFEELQKLTEIIPENNMILSRDSESRKRLWTARKSISIMVSKIAKFRLGEDIAVPVSALPEITEFCHQLSRESGFPVFIWGHAGDGNLHVNFCYDKEEQYPLIQQLINRLAGKAVDLKGSVSGEHGLGRIKKHLKTLELNSHTIELQEAIKKVFDPYGILNPALN